jgi:hypothetical protein
MPFADLDIDTTPLASDDSYSSLLSVASTVEDIFSDVDSLAAIRNVRVFGSWRVKERELLEPPAGTSHRRLNSSASESDTRLPRDDTQPSSYEWQRRTEQDWAAGIEKIRSLLEKLPNLRSLE